MALPNLQSINPMALAQAVSPYYTSAVQANMGAADVLGQIAKMRTQRQANQQPPKKKFNALKPLGGAAGGAGAGLALSMIPGVNIAAAPAMIAGGVMGGGMGLANAYE